MARGALPPSSSSRTCVGQPAASRRSTGATPEARARPQQKDRVAGSTKTVAAAAGASAGGGTGTGLEPCCLSLAGGMEAERAGVGRVAAVGEQLLLRSCIMAAALLGSLQQAGGRQGHAAQSGGLARGSWLTVHDSWHMEAGQARLGSE